MQRIDDSAELRYFLGGAATAPNALNNGATDPLRVNSWQSDDGLSLFMNTQGPIPLNKNLYVELPIRRTTGVKFEPSDDRKSVKVIFDTAPASGATLTASYLRKLIPGVRFEWRNGAPHQLPMDGHDAVRNTQAGGGELTPRGSTGSHSILTDDDCDDVVVDIASGTEGFTAYDSKDGARSPVNAQFHIEWRKFGATEFNKLKDPSEDKAGKTVHEFKVSADSTSQLFWSFSVKRLLAKWCEDHPTDEAQKKLLSTFTRARYEVRVTRTNEIQSATSQYVKDDIAFVSVQKVIYIRLSRPGVALLSLHGVGSERLNGSLPRVTCRVIGRSDVEAYVDGAWVKGPEYQSNRVWAAIDMITNKRYGGGEQFTKASNIDLVTAVAAAAWCDESVTANDVSEKRSVLSYVADTRQPLMDQVRAILAPAQIIPVLQGNVWRFIVDREVDLDAVPVIYAEGVSGDVLRSTASVAHQSVAAKFTEIQVTYRDRREDWQAREVWVAPKDAATQRRIERATAFGVDRATEARRYAEFIYTQGTNEGLQVAFAILPSDKGLACEAGDVVNLVSTRLGLDIYVRVLRWELMGTSGDQAYIQISGAEYVPAAYGQLRSAKVTTNEGTTKSLALGAPTSAEPGTGRVRGGKKVDVKIRRTA